MQEWKAKVGEQTIKENRRAAMHAKMAYEPSKKDALERFKRPAFSVGGKEAPNGSSISECVTDRRSN